MYERILRQMWARIRLRQYVMTLHAEDEMNDDQLTIFDIERAISIGEIVERQRIEMVQQSELTCVCGVCGRPGAVIRRVSWSYGRGNTLLVIEDVPMVSCSHCGESYLTADTLHELERIKQHRQLLAKQRPVPVAVFA